MERSNRQPQSRETGSSSTRRTHIPPGSGPVFAVSGRASMGRNTLNAVPCPGRLFTVISPPSRSVSRFVIAMPRPLPSILSVRLSFSRVKGSKICSRYSGFIPMPLSKIVKQRTALPFSSVRPASTSSTIVPPFGVNLIALDRRFKRIWRRRSASQLYVSPWSSFIWTSNLCCRARISGSTIMITSCSSSGRKIGVILMGKFPFSIFDISSTSLISPRR